MERSSLECLFRKSTTTAKVVDEAPGKEEIPYKIPMKIIERVVGTVIQGMQLSTLEIIYCSYMNYAVYSNVLVLL